MPMPITTNGWVDAIRAANERLPHDLRPRAMAHVVDHDPSDCVRCRSEFALCELVDLIAVLSDSGPQSDEGAE